jgi:hypothetical protein
MEKQVFEIAGMSFGNYVNKTYAAILHEACLAPEVNPISINNIAAYCKKYSNHVSNRVIAAWLKSQCDKDVMFSWGSVGFKVKDPLNERYGFSRKHTNSN